MDAKKIHLEDWALKIQAEQPVYAQKAVLLNTIPLFEARYKAELRPSSWLSKLTQRKRRDFVRNSLYLYQNWEEYDTAIASPVLSELVKIKDSSPATIDLEVSWRQFQKAVLYGGFEAFFLFAHHFDSKIEFADGGVEISEVQSFLTKNKIESKRHFVFMVCQAEAFEKSKIEFPTSFSSTATASWNIPVIEAYVFSRFWIQNMDGVRSFAEAYSEAIGQYLQSIKP